jgi:hypothetical protein
VAGVGRVGPNISLELRRAIGKARGSATDVATRFNVSTTTVYSSRELVKRELSGERYDKIRRIWVNK